MNQIKKSLILSGHKTSIALEKEFWKALEIISENKNIGIDKLIEKIDKKERNGSLASAIRVFILKKIMKLN
jgi:predicted DNA-binding ribbon-helix-helix protein